MQSNKWRRTTFARLNGDLDIASNDWTLIDSGGEHLARLYKAVGGPHDSHWFWSVLVGLDGQPFNGGTGYAATGQEAREASEVLIPGAKG